ncbi:hypothetical protein K3495_g2955 [Podosphaera aphanis]|nr:hypothetical protein K3495_g2955 [Podosphaera aphanis]
MEPFPNVYTHKKVAATASKACDICYKPTTSVLVTLDHQVKDFFYTCPAHLKDRSFCQPIIDHDAMAAHEKSLIDHEIASMKLKYQETLKKKKVEEGADAAKGKVKEDKREGESSEQKEVENKKKEELKDKKCERVADTRGSVPLANLLEESKTFALHKIFYQRRLDRKQRIEQAKRNMERLRDPGLFPSVPKNIL